MRFTLVILIIFSFTSLYRAQTLNSRHIVDLESSLAEISGIMQLNGSFIGHNDSGSSADLLEIDTLTGLINRSVHIANASNIDWEDICHDNTYIYVGDFGNNSGNRTDLRIYRVLISDFLTTPNDTVFADTISFNYSDQTDFTPSAFSTNFDCEAITDCGDSLLIATKNWGNSQSRLYKISKQPGTYSISPFVTVAPLGLVTGAYFDLSNGNLWLCGHTISDPFLVRVDSQYNLERLTTSLHSGIQVEGICEIDSENLMISVESFNTDPAKLFAFNDFYLGLKIIADAPDFKIKFQNGWVDVESKNHNNFLIELFTLNGKLCMKKRGIRMQIDSNGRSICIVRVSDLNTGQSVQKKISL